MNVAFENAPLLVELVAELRWSASVEEAALYERFAALAAACGFRRDKSPEAAVRYRPTDPSQASPVYRLGRGRFSAKALPPYKTWAAFEPKVREGLEMLDHAFRGASQDRPRFNAATMRYVDAFAASSIPGKTMYAILAEALSVHLQLPSRVALVHHIVIPVGPGEMTVRVAEGTRDRDRAVVVEMEVAMRRDIGDDPSSAMSALVEVRAPIHDLFVAVMRHLNDAISR